MIEQLTRTLERVKNKCLVHFDRFLKLDANLSDKYLRCETYLKYFHSLKKA